MLPEYEDLHVPLQDPMNLRAAPRVAADLPVQIFSTDMRGPLPGRLRDISTSGVCVATASPFALKSVQKVALTLPRGTLLVDAEGCWQRDAAGDDVILSGITFPNPHPDALDQLWEMVFTLGQRIARFLVEQTQLYELGVEEGLGLAQTSRFRDIPAGRTIYRQDTVVAGEDSIFLLIEGCVTLHARVRDAFDIETHRLRPGEIFGGLALIGAGPPADTAIAASDTRLLEIDAQSFRYMRQTRPWLGFRVGQALLRTHAVRLRELFKRLQDKL